MQDVAFISQKKSKGVFSMEILHYINKELRLIDSMYFLVFNPSIKSRKNMSYGKGRWQIRKWSGIYPKKLNLWDCYGYSKVIMTICKEEITQDGLVDVGYEDVDRRVITAIRESNYWKADYKRKLEVIDWHNERLERQGVEQLEYESRYAAKRIWRALHEPQVCLSGKEWKT